MYNDTCGSTSESEMAQASKIVFLFFYIAINQVYLNILFEM